MAGKVKWYLIAAAALFVYVSANNLTGEGSSHTITIEDNKIGGVVIDDSRD